MRSLNAEQSAKWMEKGNILLHPTEGVWGLGCDCLLYTSPSPRD